MVSSHCHTIHSFSILLKKVTQIRSCFWSANTALCVSKMNRRKLFRNDWVDKGSAMLARNFGQSKFNAFTEAINTWSTFLARESDWQHTWCNMYGLKPELFLSKFAFWKVLLFEWTFSSKLLLEPTLAFAFARRLGLPSSKPQRWCRFERTEENHVIGKQSKNFNEQDASECLSACIKCYEFMNCISYSLSDSF